MNLMLHHALYRAITLSRLVNLIGSYIYNLVFIIYASTFPNANVWIFAANMTAVVPTLFSFWVGIKADETQQKKRCMIASGFIQAVLFTVIAMIISHKTLLVFAIICLINIVTDVLSDFGSGLRLPILQHHLKKDELFEAYSFSQFITYFSGISGQILGVWLITTTNNNFSMVATINAFTFAISSCILIFKHQQLTHDTVNVTSKKLPLSKRLQQLYTSMTLIFKETGNQSFFHLVLSMVLLNALGGSISGIYHFYFLKHQIFHLNFGESLLIADLLLISGAIFGSLTPNDYFAKKSFSFLLTINSVVFIIVSILNLLHVDSLFGLISLSFGTYIMGKAVPKLDALLLEKCASDVLAQSDHFLTMLLTLSLPIGMFIFSSLAAYNLFLCWLLFGIISTITFVLTRQFQKETPTASSL